MVDKVFEEVKEFINGDKPLLRKLRILKYVVCIIILFIALCNSYWNLLGYVDLPCAPLFEEQYRLMLHSTGIMVWIFWGVYSVLYHNLYRFFERKLWVEVSYVYVLIDFLITMYFLVYALNLAIEFANGLQVNMGMETGFAFVYMAYCVLDSSYTSHKIKYQQRVHVAYTEYCDSEGRPIPKEAKVFYKGKKHIVVEYEGVCRLLPHRENWIHSDLIKLEDAASDLTGKLLLMVDNT